MRKRFNPQLDVLEEQQAALIRASMLHNSSAKVQVKAQTGDQARCGGHTSQGTHTTYEWRGGVREKCDTPYTSLGY